LNFVPSRAYASKVVMLSGDEEALRRRALTDTLTLATQDGDFDLQTYEADESPPSDWFASAGTAPFLSEKRTIVVRHLLRRDPIPPRSSGTDADSKAALAELAKGLGALPDSSLLVLVADEETGDENKQRRLVSTRKAWEKLVKDAGGLVAEFATNTKQIGDAIKLEAERLGKKISDASAQSLADMTGANFSRAAEELDKLAVYLGAETHIREADIRAVVVPSREWNVYKLVDSIVDGAVPEALRQLRILVGSQTKAEDAAFSRILPTLSRQLRLLWQARLCVEARCSPDAPTEVVRKRLPGKPNISSELPFRQGRLMQQARRVDLPALRTCIQSASDADAKLKGLLDSFSPIETLEEMVLEMVQVIGAKASVR